MEIPKIKNPFKKDDELASAKAPSSSKEEDEFLDDNINSIESKKEDSEEIKDSKEDESKEEIKEVSLDQIIQNFDLRLRKIEYNLRLL